MKAARTEQPAAHAGDKCESQYLLSGVRSRFKVMLLSRAQISREAVYGANLSILPRSPRSILRPPM